VVLTFLCHQCACSHFFFVYLANLIEFLGARLENNIEEKVEPLVVANEHTFNVGSTNVR